MTQCFLENYTCGLMLWEDLIFQYSPHPLLMSIILNKGMCTRALYKVVLIDIPFHNRNRFKTLDVLYKDYDKPIPPTIPTTKTEKTQSKPKKEVFIKTDTLLSVDELMEELDVKSIQKRGSRKKRVKAPPQPRPKPRILRTNISRANSPAKKEDVLSLNSNKYNKRFTKTKKPTRL